MTGLISGLEEVESCCASAESLREVMRRKSKVGFSGTCARISRFYVVHGRILWVELV